MGKFITEQDAKDYLKTLYLSAYLDEDGIEDEALLTQDIEGLEGEILGYVRQTYDDDAEIDETGTPQAFALLRKLAFALLVKAAYMRFDYSGVPASVTSEAENAIFRLRDIGSGKMKLPDLSQTPKSGGISFEFNPVSFSRSKMRGF